jgi:hypothetical protein
MGQEIVYCSRCQKQLRGRDFEKGAAYRLDALTCCQACAPEVMKSLPAASMQEMLRQIHAPQNAPPTVESRSRLPSLSSSSSARVSAAAHAGSGSPVGLIVAGVVVAVIVLVLVLSVASSPKPTKESAPPGPREVVVPSPAPRPTPDPPVIPAADPLRQARDYVRSNPTDFTGQVNLYERALEGLKAGPAMEEGRRELESVRKTARDRMTAELAALDLRVGELCAKESFDPSLERIEASRRLLNAPDWAAAIQKRVDDVNRQATALFGPLKDSALQAQRRGAKEEVQSARDRVARWGLKSLAADLDAALAEATSDPKVPATSPEAAAFARCREAAFGHARARDYEAAAAELKRGTGALRDDALLKAAADDAEALRQAAQALKEVQQVPPTWAKGQKLALDVSHAAGGAMRVEGTLLRMDPYRIEIERPGAAPVVVLIADVKIASLAGLLKQPRNARGLTLLGLLEGETQSAADVPERYVTWAQSAAGPEPAREVQAWSRLAEAEMGAEDPATAAESAAKFATVLREFADTRVVRRNRAFLQSRSQGGKEYLFFPEDLTPGGTFAWVKNPKTETCVMSGEDSDPAKTKDNFVELTFSALPDTEYRCWAYVGACCAETFLFFHQATDLVGLPSKDAKDPVACEPGSGAYLSVKHTLTSLKKTHAQHTGPKSPARWEWISIPLPKAAAAGPRKLRLLTNQKGFSVAFVSVSAAKTDHPRESEAKSWETARNQTPGAKPLNRAAPASKDKPAPSDQVVVFALDLAGGTKPAAVQQGSVVKAPDRAGDRWCLYGEPQPGGVSPMFVDVAGPNGTKFEGEDLFVFDYWLDTQGAQISFTFGNRSRGTEHSGAVPEPVLGKWTRASFRIADLGDAAKRYTSGDNYGGVYIHAVGGATRKFYIDNLQIVRPRK